MNGLTKDMATEFETPLQMEGALAQAERLAIPVGSSTRELTYSATPALWWRKGRLEARGGRSAVSRGASPRWVEQPEFLLRMSNLARSRTRKRTTKQRVRE